ncbi:MAG: hypothetical protein MJA29_05170 [Candidatus Omnitrophica bacterium]|nr:hypothetical protein [Candidatus Omnitrophota bacterium]
MRSEKKLGEILRDKGLISDEELREALRQQRKKREFIGAILVRNNFLSEKELVENLAEQFGLPVVELKDAYIDWNLVSRFSPSLILDAGCFPVREDGSSVTVAVTNPLDAWAIKEAQEQAGGAKVKLVLTPVEDMHDAMTRYKQHVKGNILKM